jgi:hypothetical protein
MNLPKMARHFSGGRTWLDEGQDGAIKAGLQ